VDAADAGEFDREDSLAQRTCIAGAVYVVVDVGIATFDELDVVLTLCPKYTLNCTGRYLGAKTA